MAGFFSLQPAPEGESNLSSFASGNPGLEHVGSSQSYLDPSQGKGETLHSPFETPGDTAVSGSRPSGLMAPNGDETGGTAIPGGTSALTGAQTVARTPKPVTQTAPSTQLSADQIQSLQTLGQVQTGVNAIPGSAIASLKSAIKGSPEGAAYSDPEIDAFIESLNDPSLYKTGGALEGNRNIYEMLNPTESSGFGLGFDSNLDTSWMNELTGVRSGTPYTDYSKYGDPNAESAYWSQGTDASVLDKFGKGDIMGALGITSAAISGDPAKILASLNNVAPTVAKYITDNQSALKDVGSIASVAGGSYMLYQGIQSQNPTQIAGGLGQLLQGAGTSQVGIDVLSQLTGASAQTITAAFGALGGVTGAFSLYQGIENGDPVQALLGAASIYGALSTVAPTIFPALTTLASQALIAIAPSVASALGITGAAGAGMAGAIAAGTAGAGVGAATAGIGTAAATLSAGLTAGIMVLPLVIAYIGISISDMIDAKNEMDDRIFDQTKFSHNLKPQYDDITALTDSFSGLNAGTPEAAHAYLDKMAQFDANQNTLEGMGVSLKFLMGEGPSGMMKAGPSMYTNLQPQLLTEALGGVRAVDIIARSGETPPMTPFDALKILGSRLYNSSEAGSGGAFNTAWSPFIEQNLRTVIQPAVGQQIAGYGTEGSTIYSPATSEVRGWVPGAEEWANQNIRPGHYEEDIFRLLGGTVTNMFGGELALDTNVGVAGKARMEDKWRQYYNSLGMGTGHMASPETIAQQEADWAADAGPRAERQKAEAARMLAALDQPQMNLSDLKNMYAQQQNNMSAP